MTRTISNSDDVLDSRDVIARLAELQDDLDGLESDLEDAETDEEKADAQAALDDWDDYDEYEALKALCAEGEANADDWPYGAALIRDSYFMEYAKELAEDIGAIGKNLDWPACHIDWDAAADALKMDYSSIDFCGVEYWVRS